MKINKITRKKLLLQKVLIVNGQPGCGKTLISSIVSSFDRVEIMKYSSELENITRLNYLKKITDDAASSFLKCCLDEMLYSNLMSRNINFRFTDLSSAFRYPMTMKYIKRLFNKGDENIPNMIIDTKPILHLATHNLYPYSKILFSTFKNQMTFIEVVRHPLYMIKQQTINYINQKKNSARIFHIKILLDSGNEVFIDDPRINGVVINDNTSPIDLAVYSMKVYFDFILTNLNSFSKNNIILIPFENFVIDPSPYMEQIYKSLQTNQTKFTKNILKREKVPRKKFSDGINLKVYEKLGWTKSIKGYTERDELNERIKWTKEMNISSKCSKILDEISEKYEKMILGNSI